MGSGRYPMSMMIAGCRGLNHFVTKLGVFLTLGMPMSRLTHKMKTYVTKALQSCGVDLVTVSKVKVHREFLGGDVAGFVGRKRTHRPELLVALILTDQSVLQRVLRKSCGNVKV